MYFNHKNTSLSHLELSLPSLLSQEWKNDAVLDVVESQINDKTSSIVLQTMDFLVPSIPANKAADHQNSTQGGGGQVIGEFNYTTTKGHQQKHNENQENHHNVMSMVPKDFSNNQMNQNKVVLATNQQIMSQKMNKKHKFNRHSLKDVPEQNLHLHGNAQLKRTNTHTY